MKILFLGDVVGISGSSKILNNLRSEIEKKKIDFVIINGENSAEPGVGLTEKTSVLLSISVPLVVLILFCFILLVKINEK